MSRLRDLVRRNPRMLPVAPVALVGATLLGLTGLCSGYPCVPLGLRYGVWLEQCPTSDLKLAADMSAYNLGRGLKGTVSLSPSAQYLVSPTAPIERVDSQAFSSGVEVVLSLLDEEGASTPLPGLSWSRHRGSLSADVKLPALPDGAYRLVADLTTGFDHTRVALDVPLFTPALAHLMTDRPLYEPGHTVQMRSVTLSARERVGLDQRSGTWTVLSPAGHELLQERAKTGPTGVAHTSLALSQMAEEGRYTAVWRSGSVEDRVGFDVRPFQLPKMEL